MVCLSTTRDVIRFFNSADAHEFSDSWAFIVFYPLQLLMMDVSDVDSLLGNVAHSDADFDRLQ